VILHLIKWLSLLFPRHPTRNCFRHFLRSELQSQIHYFLQNISLDLPELHLPQGPQAAVKAMAAEMAPTLAYAYAQGDSITFAANTDGGPFGLSPATIFGMPNALEMQSIISRSMHNQK